MNNDSRRWYRKWNLDMTAEEVRKIVKDTPPEEQRTSRLRGPYTPEDSDALVGRTLEFSGEDRDLKWQILEKNLLRFT